MSYAAEQVSCGKRITHVLKELKVAKSTYYRWKKLLAGDPEAKEPAKGSRREVTPEELEAIKKAKADHPELFIVSYWAYCN